MTNKIRRTEIQIETHSVTTIRGLGDQNTKFCERCQSSVIGFTLDQATAFLLKTDVQASIARGEFQRDISQGFHGYPMIRVAGELPPRTTE